MNERMMVLALRLGYFAWGAFWGAWGVLLPQFKLDLALSDAQIGSALAGVSVGAIPAMLLGTKMLERSPQAGLRVLLCLFALAAVLLSRAMNFFTLLMLLVALGVASGLLDITLNVNVSDAERGYKRKLFHSMHGMFPLGVILAAPLTDMARDLGVKTVGILGLVALLMLLPALLLRHRRLPARDVGVDGKADAAKAAASRLQSIGTVLKNRSLLLASALIIVFLFLEHAVEQWSALFIEQTYKSSASVSSLAPCLYMFSLFAGRMLVARIGSSISFSPLLMTGTLGTTLLLIAVAGSSSTYIALASFAAMGLVMAPLVPGLYAWISNNTDERSRVRVLSAATALSYLGYLLSPVFFGSVAGAGGLSRAWLALAVTSALAFVLVLIEGKGLAAVRSGSEGVR